jgi:PHP family Zn ribbon phosphoesterase
MRIRADLHIHSCLSPCGSLFNSPSEIARSARRAGLDLIALTDHNSSLNCEAFLEACAREEIAGICGMEATSAEEAHCLCLFENLETALDFSAFIRDHQQKVPLRSERMGDQVVVNLSEEIIGTVDYLLISATDLSIDEMEAQVHSRGGLFIPAHVDRRAFSLTSQLGFIPRSNYDALEWYHRDNPRIADYPEYPAISNSDAHDLESIGRKSFAFEAEAAGFAGLKQWLGQRGSGINRHPSEETPG